MKATTIDTRPLTKLLRTILELIVQHPQELLIEAKPHAASVEVYITPHAADTAKVIGKKSATYLGFRTVLAYIGANHGYRTTLAKIQEAVTGEKEPWKYTTRDQWPKAKVLAALRDTVAAVYPQAGQEIQTYESRDAKSTTLEVFIEGNKEDLDPSGWLAKSIAAIWTSIGVTQGHDLNVDLIFKGTAQPGEAGQPKSAAGRFAKELEH